MRVRVHRLGRRTRHTFPAWHTREGHLAAICRKHGHDLAWRQRVEGLIGCHHRQWYYWFITLVCGFATENYYVPIDSSRHTLWPVCDWELRRTCVVCITSLRWNSSLSVIITWFARHLEHTGGYFTCHLCLDRYPVRTSWVGSPFAVKLI